MKKRLFAVLMSLTLIFTYIPLMAYAEGEEAQTNDTEVTEAVQNAEGESDAVTEAAPETESEAAPATTTENSTGEAEAEAPAPQKVETSDDQAKRAEVVQSEESVSDLYTEEVKNAYSYETYNIGTPINVNLPANSTITYKLEDPEYDPYKYSQPLHLYVENLNSNEQDLLTVTVIDKDGKTKKESSLWNLTNDYYDSSVGSGSNEISGGYWSSYLYSIREGDSIVLTTGGSRVNFSMLAQKIVVPTCYAYDSRGEFYYGYLGNEAQLISILTDEDTISDAVVYLDNMSGAYDFSYYIMSSDNQMVSVSDGYNWNALNPGYCCNTPYRLNDEEYYLLIFNSPDQNIKNDNIYDYESWNVDEEYADFSLCISPRNLKYYSVSGIKNKTYTGKAIGQSVGIEYGDITLGGDDYKISYSNNKNVGLATVTISGKAPYTGLIKRTFKINPKGTSISKLTRGKKAFTVKWKKQTAKMSGSVINSYQVQYSTNKNFSSAKIKTITGYKKYSKKITGLKKKKTYYVRVRTCKKVNGTWYYSPWSAAKKVKTK